jgi:hypothetical protein
VTRGALRLRSADDCDFPERKSMTKCSFRVRSSWTSAPAIGAWAPPRTGREVSQRAKEGGRSRPGWDSACDCDR